MIFKNKNKNKNKNKIHTLLFTTESLPFNSPGGKRIFNLFDRGIIDPNISILLCLGKVNRSQKEFKKFKEVKFVNSILNYKKTLNRVLIAPISLFSLVFKLFYLMKKYKVENTYIYSRLGIYTVPVVLISRLYKIKVFIDCTEWFLIKEMGGMLNIFQELLHRYISMNLAEGFYAIGNNMMSLLYKKYKGKSISLIHPSVPSFTKGLIENTIKSFDNNNNNKLKKILYAGSFKKSDDPIFFLESLLDLSYEYAFQISIISKAYYGGNFPKKINSIIKDIYKNLGEKLLIYNYLEDERFYNEIISSNIILLPRSNSGFSMYNQPLRLSEYSLFKKDILTTNIDEQYYAISDNIHLYQTSNKESFKEILSKLLIK